MSDTKPASSKIIPNTFQCPNALVDDTVMSVLSGNETKCYLVIVRKTFGWHKASDRIAKSQIMEFTGLGENAVDTCMVALVSFGLVLRLAENDPNTNQGVLWGLQVDDSKIDWDALSKRETDIAKKHADRMMRLRARRGGGVDHQPQVDGQGGGGVDHQGTQKPLSKANVVVVVNGDNFKLYEAEFGVLTPMIADAIKDAEKTYPPEWIPEAMQIAVANNKRSWKYVEGILKNCKAKNVRPSLNKLEATYGNTSADKRRPAQGKTSVRSDGQANGGGDDTGIDGKNQAPSPAAEAHRERWKSLRERAKVPAVS